MQTGSADEAARLYTRAGFYVLPVPFKEKGCRLPGWQDLRLTESELCSHFDRRAQNIALLTGIDGLTDIDCDSAEAISTASALLPMTDFVFGRPSKPASHYFYVSDAVLRSEQFEDPVTGTMILELRCAKTDGGIGRQTCVPPSTHPSGEAIRFENGHMGWPATVRADDLSRAAKKVAAAALLARHWPGQGSRHKAFLALAGALGRAGWLLEEAAQFHRAIYTVLWPDAPDVQGCAREVESSFARLQDGRGATTGLRTLCGLVDERVVKRALEWLEVGTPARGRAALENKSGARADATRLEEYVFDPDHDPPEERIYYDGLMGEGDLVVWLGREKHRKTNLILQLSICAATGRDFLVFRFAAPGPLKVVVLDYESKTGSLQRRYRAICGALNLTEHESALLRDNLRIIEIRKLARAGQTMPRFVVGANTKFKNDEDLISQSESFWKAFAEQYPADLYVFDPMRSMHNADENDSSIEVLLSRLRRTFPRSAVVVAHHMRKVFAGGKDVSLQADMRLWSDGARGSTAIKAHTDVIVCQERSTDNQGNETIHLGVFLKDGADVQPLPLEESDAESFFWEVRPEVPAHLNVTLDRLTHGGSSFADLNAAVKLLIDKGVKRPTAYRHVGELMRLNFLRQDGGRLVLSGSAKVKHAKICE